MPGENITGANVNDSRFEIMFNLLKSVQEDTKEIKDTMSNLCSQTILQAEQIKHLSDKNISFKNDLNEQAIYLKKKIDDCIKKNDFEILHNSAHTNRKVALDKEISSWNNIIRLTFYIIGIFVFLAITYAKLKELGIL